MIIFRLCTLMFLVFALSACATSSAPSAFESLSDKLSGLEGVDVKNAPNAEAVVYFDGVLFEIDSHELNEDALNTVSKVAAILTEDFPYTYLYIEGHTDSIGSPEYNQSLSELRANRIRYAIIESGFNPDRMDVHGAGELKPACVNNTVQGRACNRRVEIVIVNIQ